MTMPWVPPDLPPLPAIDPREVVKRPPRDWSWFSRPVGLFSIGVVVIAVGAVITGVTSTKHSTCDLAAGIWNYSLLGILVSFIGVGFIMSVLSKGKGEPDPPELWVGIGIWVLEMMAIWSVFEWLTGHSFCF